MEIHEIHTASGTWEIEQQCGRWVATHCDIERGDRGGVTAGPVTLTALTLNRLVEEISDWEAERAEEKKR